MSQLYNIRTINGQPAPMPQSLVATRYTLDKDSYRSASGLLIRNVLGNKMKFELTFPPMQKAELQSILAILDSNKFTVTYEDVINGVVKSGEFYRGDISIKPIWIKNQANTNVIYDSLSISLIEY